jgi:hypothetical protein
MTKNYNIKETLKKITSNGEKMLTPKLKMVTSKNYNITHDNRKDNGKKLVHKIITLKLKLIKYKK